MGERIIFRRTDDNGREQHLIGKEGGDHEIHVDGAWGAQMNQTTFKVNLFTLAPALANEVERRELAVRLTMPLPALFSLRDFLIRQCQGAIDKKLVETIEMPSDQPEAAPEKE